MKVLSVFLFIFCYLLFLQECCARPTSSRVKRVSDQRLAELETLVALSKMSGKLVTVPLGFGKIDPAKIGRRRRSDSRLMQKLFVYDSEENPYFEELERLFEED